MYREQVELPFRHSRIRGNDTLEIFRYTINGDKLVVLEYAKGANFNLP